MKLQTNHFKHPVFIFLALILLTSCEDAQTESSTLIEYRNKIEAYEKELEELKSQLDKQDPGTRRRPNHIIQSDFAKEIYHLYDKREALINEVVGQDGEGVAFEATRSLFYNINDLQQYIRYVRIKSREANVTPSGFRFYFALYPDNYVRDGKDKRYAKRQTFFIAPTKEVKDADGNIQHLGYTLDNNLKVELLSKKLGFDSRFGFDSRWNKDGKQYQTAGFFNLNLNSSFIEENSLIANEINASPPKGSK